MLYLIFIYSLIRSGQSNDNSDGISLNNITTISSLEYLGCGYNLLFNKKKRGKESENDNEIDTNYKNPIIKFNWTGNMKNINTTLQYLHPDGTFIYNFPNCSIKQENKLEKNLKSFENMISSEVSVDVINLKTDANISNSKSKTAYKNNLEKIIYCSVYIAGINQANHIEYTKPFLSAILTLKDTLDHERKKGCSLKLYKRKICSTVRQSWVDFLNSYGTHYVSKIVLGGKIVYNEDTDNNINTDTNSINLNLSLTGLDVNSVNDKNRSLNNDLKNNITNIYGGLTYNNNKHWFNELKEDPVPIKLVLTSFKDIFIQYNIYNEYMKFLKSY